MVSVDISSLSVQPAVTMPRENLGLIKAKHGLCLTLPAERESDRLAWGTSMCFGGSQSLGKWGGVICWGQGEWMALKRHKPQPAHHPPPRTLPRGVCERVKISSANQEKINRAVPLGIVGTGEGLSQVKQSQCATHVEWYIWPPTISHCQPIYLSIH